MVEKNEEHTLVLPDVYLDKNGFKRRRTKKDMKNEREMMEQHAEKSKEKKGFLDIV
jgi:hypothetical protein